MDLKTYREKKKTTQVEVAKRLGISQPHYSRLEAKKDEPSLPLLRVIMEVTGGAVGINDVKKEG